MADDPKLHAVTEDEIAKLPRWVQVALAARCARRMQPLFQASWPEAPLEHVEALDRAIALAEAMASVPNPTDDNARTDEDAATYAADAALAARAAASAGAGAAACASDVAAYAADTARAAYAAYATRTAVYAARAASYAHNYSFLPDLIKDYRLVLDLSVRELWDDNSPVSPEVFGPLWPSGLPESWHSIMQSKSSGESSIDQEQLMALRFPILPTDGKTGSTRQLAEHIARVIVASNDLHQVHNGGGIELVDGFLIQSPALIPEPSGKGGD